MTRKENNPISDNDRRNLRSMKTNNKPGTRQVEMICYKYKDTLYKFNELNQLRSNYVVSLFLFVIMSLVYN